MFEYYFSLESLSLIQLIGMTWESGTLVIPWYFLDRID